MSWYKNTLEVTYKIVFIYISDWIYIRFACLSILRMNTSRNYYGVTSEIVITRHSLILISGIKWFTDISFRFRNFSVELQQQS